MTGRRRVTHSLEAVLDEAIALLDEAGEPALTFRALAARLGGGVASIYWYVSSRDELLDRATDEVMARLLDRTAELGDGPDPVANLRALSLALFEEMRRRPWFGTYMLRNTGLQPHSMLMFDRLGQQTMRLDLTPKQRFHVVSSLVSYVVGVAVDMAQPPPKEFVDSGLEPAEFLAGYAERWRALDPEGYPFAHHVADEFAVHDDEEVFRSGLDLLLDGLRTQAGR
ncbi:TetR/AcrR family transcriptional regulator [Klenkia sp. PcliD-1-E]|uniref:TetR/AcrR family transcriptional regulator n=1 Tax=Klenkia sp. PcliD-1-E TaxID=2954492 RepID=UPI00209723EB|nr:TetR/AcrR family transcriptional regulator C-terminal domain-containing protein [Klenkia sp. PcliD-1-E]MCO7220540.1 TetR/AcrR family transcriptional regulator C-terminal domain-containing protein [Klenkia sp. PcliD-1-E]